MYLEHYGLKAQPFGLAADPELFWAGPQLQETCRAFEEALRREEPCVLLTGDVGTGKTVLVRRVLQTAGAEFATLGFSATRLKAADLYGILALELGLETGGDRSAGDARAALAEFLPRAFAGRNPIWLVVEEAHRLDFDLLRAVVALAGFAAGGRRWFRVFLVAAPAIEERLAEPEGAEIRGRIGLHRRLQPLSSSDTRDYIAHRLAHAGAERMLFTAEALERVFALSRGYPRLINMVCDHALLYGFGAHREVVTPEVVEECSQDLLVALEKDTIPDIEYRPGMVPSPNLPNEPGRSGRTAADLRRILAVTAAAGLLGLAAWLLTR